MKKRKVLAMLLTVVLGAGTLFGCGQNANEQAAAEPAAESQTQTTESKAETQAEQAKEDEEPVHGKSPVKRNFRGQKNPRPRRSGLFRTRR